MSNHLGGWIAGGDPHTFMPDVWQALLDKYPDIGSVVDIGCGEGRNLAWFKDEGKVVLGVDGDPTPLQVAHSLKIRTRCNDYTQGGATIGYYDLALCTEFAEHVEAQYEKYWLADMERCKYVLFSFALPGQGGHHHVNEQPEDYWLDRFAEYGFTPDWEFTYKHRNPKARWGRNTLTLFINRNI